MPRLGHGEVGAGLCGDLEEDCIGVLIEQRD